jgi:ribosome maturation protein SDO1
MSKMTQTTARIKKTGKHFEILVDLDTALKFKKGESSDTGAESDKIFTDIKKGNVASEKDLSEAFKTSDVSEIIERIIKEGEVLVTQEHRDEERENKIKQIVDFLSRNTINPQTGNPHTPERIKKAIEEAHVNIKNVSIENQVEEIIEEISKIIPIKIETKKIKLTIPAIHTGKAYSIIGQYKEEENWLNDGSLEATVNIPAGMIMEFYDKINSATHGSVLTQEIKE